MIFISKIFLKSVFLLLVILGSFTVAAQDNKKAVVKLGIVDLAEVTRKSFMSKDIARQIDKKRKMFRAEIKKEEGKIREMSENLEKQRDVLSKDKFNEKMQSLRKRTIELQRKVQQRNQEFIKIRAFGTRVFEKERVKAIMDVATKHNFTLILRQREVLVRADFLNITELVIAALNKRKKSFRIPDNLSKVKN
ncbi:MAG: hypothetical protein CFH08_01210 [Alphaproteobacteria bacterium MarineAlpha3_Bin7]|nr:MAG: hypothetical protein CFH08_01210 [Alphaproteobacteria bacterium MarineAlpha3_Bin7]